MSSAAEEFENGKLGAAQDFRLLRLAGGAHGSHISCELFSSSFQKALDYEALSYTWGVTELVDSITVNGKNLRITDGLFTAMQYLRLPDRDRLLWIDAVCINQRDGVERGQQVQKMRQIFSRAARVLVWLGKATIEVEYLMDCTANLNELSLQDQSFQEYNMAKAKTGLETLLKRPWFRRVLVLQEVFNAKSALLCVGTRSVSAATFATLPALLRFENGAHCAAVLEIMHDSSQQVESSSIDRDLCSLTLRFRNCKASDERDKIYALLGMCSDRADVAAIRPDYTIDLRDVVENVMYHLLEVKLVSVATVLDLLLSYQELTAVFITECYEKEIMPPEGMELEQLLNTLDARSLASSLLIERRKTESDKTEPCFDEALLLRDKQGGDPLQERRAKQLDTSKRPPQEGLQIWLWIEYWRRPRRDVLVLLVGKPEEAFYSALKARCSRISEWLVKYIPSLLNNEEFLNNTLLMVSAWGMTKLTRVLIDLGANVNYLSIEDPQHRAHRPKLAHLSPGFQSPLRLASKFGHLDIVRYLLDAGADANGPTTNSKTPLH